MLEIAICDDDIKIIKEIEQYIEEYGQKEYKITAYLSGEQLLIEKHKFDLIFMDIDMKVLDGIETARQIRKYDKAVKIVYVTNFVDYTYLAFEVHAFGYLNKPIRKEQIYKQLEEVTDYSKDNEKVYNLEFMTLEGLLRLSAREIYYFEYLDRKVKIKALKKEYFIKEKITSIAENMRGYDFIVPHKSFVINLYHIKAIKSYDIFMMDGSRIPLSQKKSVEIREQFNIFLEKHIKNM